MEFKFHLCEWSAETAEKSVQSTQLVTDEGHNPENWKLLLYLH